MKTLIFYLQTLLIISLVNAQKSRPNILVIFSDDHAQQAISAYGSKLMKTPNIDRIAREGAIFRNSFVTNSLCAPSRAAFLTGKYGHINGLIDNSPRRLFNGSQEQIQKILRGQQYQTAWIGKWHLQSLPQGFDFWRILPDQGSYFQPGFINMKNDTVKHAGYVTDLISDFSLDWLNHRDTSNPFFLVVGEKATHREWMPDIQDLGAFDDVDFPMPVNFFDDYKDRRAAFEQDMTIRKTMVLATDLKVGANYMTWWMFSRMSALQKEAYQQYYKKVEAEYEKVKNDSLALIKWKFQRYLKDYLSTAKSLDRNIGRILKYLDSTGLARNTIVIYTSDQGFYLGEHGWFDKRFMYEESFRTPLVMRYPGYIKQQTQLNELVMNIDLAPTLLELAGLTAPAEMQGKSFTPLLKGKAKPKDWRKSVYYHYYEYPDPHRVAPHFGVRTEQYKLIRFYGPHDDWELFDIKKDPTEMKNLIHDEKFASIIKTLKKELSALVTMYKDTVALQIMNRKD